MGEHCQRPKRTIEYMIRLYPPKWQIAFKHMRRCLISLIKRKKIPLWYPCILLDWQKFQSLVAYSGGKEKNHTFLYIGRSTKYYNPYDSVFDNKLCMCFSCNPEISFLGIYSSSIPLQTPNSIVTWLFVIVLYMIWKDWRISNIQPMGDLLNKWWPDTQWLYGYKKEWRRPLYTVIDWFPLHFNKWNSDVLTFYIRKEGK